MFFKRPFDSSIHPTSLLQSERGFALPLVVVAVLLIGGLFLAVQGVQQHQNLSSRADNESVGDNARYHTWNGDKTVAEMKAELKGKPIPGPNYTTISNFDDKSPYQVLKAYQYLPALKTNSNVADQRVFSCTYNVGSNLDDMPAVPQQAEVGKEMAITIAQKWEDVFDGCATASIVPKIYLNEIKPENVILQDWGSGQIGVFDGVDHQGVPTNEVDKNGNPVKLPFEFDDKLDGNPSWNADKCFAKMDVDPNNQNEKDDRGRSLYRLGAGRFVQNGTGNGTGYYESFVRSCFFTPDRPGNYIVEAHYTHGRNECRHNQPDNNKGDLVQTCRFTVAPSGQGGRGQVPPPPVSQVPESAALTAPSNVQVSCNASNTLASLSWVAVNGATNYKIRLNKDPDTTGFDPTSGSSGDQASDTVSGAATTVSVIPGATYDFWVHASNAQVPFSDATHARFSCNASAPPPSVPPTNPTGKPTINSVVFPDPTTGSATRSVLILGANFGINGVIYYSQGGADEHTLSPQEWSNTSVIANALYSGGNVSSSGYIRVCRSAPSYSCSDYVPASRSTVH
jgi:hypothetical protein